MEKSLKRGIAVEPIKLKYDFKWEWHSEKEDGRQWTLLSHYIDANGYDRWHGSFSLFGLRQLGIIRKAA